MPSIYELKKNLSLHKGEVLGDFVVHDVEVSLPVYSVLWKGGTVPEGG